MLVAGHTSENLLQALLLSVIIAGVLLIAHLLVERQEKRERERRDKLPKRPPFRRGWDD